MNLFDFFKPKKQNREYNKPEKRNSTETSTSTLEAKTPSPSSQAETQAASLQPEAPASALEAKTPATPPDSDSYIKEEEIYTPKKPSHRIEKVSHIEISYEQAWEQGWHFKRKSRKRMRITHYTGPDRDVIIPAKIEGHIVNEIGGRAFYGCDVDSVIIPDTVIKLNPSCFCTSTVKEITFAEGITEIPDDTFRSCERLSKVHLPTTLRSIGKRAFHSCKNLTYINIPLPSGNSIGEEAFQYSGLNDFAIFRVSDGNVFSNTPLQKKYKLILASSNRFYKNFDYDIALTGNGANLKFPGGSIYFGKNSIATGCTLDLSNCDKINIDTNAFICEKYLGRPTLRNTQKVIIPQDEKGIYIPTLVNAYYPDGRKYAGYIVIKRIDGDKATLRVSGKELPSFSVTFPRTIVERTRESKIVEHRTIRLAIESEEPLHFHEYAVDNSAVESISFPHICGEGELFDPDCWHLHKVEWKEWNKEYCAYIPSEEILFQWSSHQYFAHRQLLKAFSGRRNKLGLYRFFDSSIIDQVFTEPISNYTEFHRPPNKPLRLSQRSKILIAVDVLRSSESLFENREMYIKYLQSHERYAKILCQKLPEKWQEYKDFLESFYEQN